MIMLLGRKPTMITAASVTLVSMVVFRVIKSNVALALATIIGMTHFSKTLQYNEIVARGKNIPQSSKLGGTDSCKVSCQIIIKIVQSDRCYASTGRKSLMKRNGFFLYL